MPVTCTVQHKLAYSKTGKSWLISPWMIMDKDNQKWLKIEAHCFGLINLLSAEKVEAKARPTLNGDLNFKKIIDTRNKEVFNKQDNLFEENAQEPKTKKRKRHEVRDEDGPVHMMVEVENDKKLCCLKPTKKTESLYLQFTEENLEIFFDFMSKDLQLSTSGSKRSYVRSGKYKAKKADNVDDEDSCSNEQSGE